MKISLLSILIYINFTAKYKIIGYIYIFIAIALDESIFLNVLHFPMKYIKSRDLEATRMGRARSKPPSDVVCLVLLSRRWSRIVMTLGAKI